MQDGGGEPSGNRLEAVSGEIVINDARGGGEVVEGDSIVGEIAEDSGYMVHDTLRDMPTVEADGAFVSGEYKIPKVDEWMTDVRRMEVAREIRMGLRGKRMMNISDLVDAVARFVPDGIRRPELIDLNISRAVYWGEVGDVNPDMMVTFMMMKMECRIVVERDCIKIYASIGDRFVLCAK